jgi:hypothetical protein
MLTMYCNIILFKIVSCVYLRDQQGTILRLTWRCGGSQTDNKLVQLGDVRGELSEL